MQGAVPGCKKRPIALRQTLLPQTSRTALEEVKLKFIDTSSKFGHGAPALLVCDCQAMSALSLQQLLCSCSSAIQWPKWIIQLGAHVDA